MGDQLGVVIGVVGTLLGASLTGGVTLLQGRQSSREKQQDRLEQRWLIHREARREAYLKLLSKHYAFDKIVEALWVSRPSSNGQLISDSDAVIADLWELVTVVKLEGPPAVGEAAQELVKVNWDALFGLYELDRIATQQGDDPRLIDVVTRHVEELDEKRHDTLAAFIRAARAAIGGEAGDLK